MEPPLNQTILKSIKSLMKLACMILPFQIQQTLQPNTYTSFDKIVIHAFLYVLINLLLVFICTNWIAIFSQLTFNMFKVKCSEIHFYFIYEFSFIIHMGFLMSYRLSWFCWILGTGDFVSDWLVKKFET